MIGAGAPAPSKFPDPEHVLQAIFDKLEENMQEQQISALSLLMIRSVSKFYRSSEWRPYFDSLMKKDEKIRFYVEGIISRFDESTSISRQSDRPLDGGRHGIHDSCVSNTGKLARCNGCTKLEGKKGEWKECSRCQSAV
eukprot:12484609-Ditylum_brightwellii.AAC.1